MAPSSMKPSASSAPSSAVQFAEFNSKAVLEIFRRWDEDSSGCIDRDELSNIMYKVSPSLSADQIDVLLECIDTNFDGVIDYTEFVAWLTNRAAQYTVGTDGWMTDFNLKSLLKPLFQIWDKDGSGHITREEFCELSQILSNSLRLHPLAKGDLLVVDLEDKEFVSLDDFVTWQTGVLEQSGVPNNKLPDLINTLVDSVRCIFDIEHLNQKGTNSDKTFSALSNTIEVVAQTTRQLYAPKLSDVAPKTQAQRIKDAAACRWSAPPSNLDMQLLARTFAKAHGLRPVGFDAGKAHQNVAASNSPTRASRGPKGKAKRTSFNTRVRESLGQIVACIPGIINGNYDPAKGPNWFAAVDRTSFDAKGEAVEDILIYELDRSEIVPAWCLRGEGAFREALAALGRELQLFGILKGRAIMGDQLTWKGVEGSLGCAVQFSVLTKEEAAKVEKEILLKAAAEVKESRHFSELKDMGMTLEDAAREYLDSQVILSPLDVLAQGAALKLFEVSEDLWKQLAPKKT